MALTRITKGVIKPNENYDTHNINSTGIVTAIGLDINGNGDISGNLSVGGVLTYEDVTSIDSVGIITAQSDIHVGGGVSAVGVGTFGGLDINGNVDISGDLDVDGHTNLDNLSVAGVSTFAERVIISGGKDLFMFDNGVIRLGDNSNTSDFQMFHNGHTRLNNASGSIYITNTTTNGSIRLSPKAGEEGLIVRYEGAVQAYHSNTIRIETTSSGVNVSGTTTTTGLAVSGVSTFTGAIDANGDLDVDGHTNLDNVSIAGITTTTENIRIQGNNKYLTVGASNQIGVVHTGGEAFITNSTGHFTHRSDVHKWENYAGSSEYLRITSNGNIGAGGITSPLWTSGGGIHLNDNYGIGFGNGGSGRPDFQLMVTDGSKLEFRCGYGADTADIVMDTSGRLLVGTTSQSISSNELFEVKSTAGGFSHFRNNSSSYAPIYIDNEATNNGSTLAPLITITDGGGNRAGLLLNNSSVFNISGQGAVTFSTGATVGNATERLRIASDGKVLMDNSTGTFTIGGDNVYDSAKINLMIGSPSQTSATTEATAIVIHDRNSQRNGIEGAGSWKSKIVFRSTQINGNYQSEGASIVHDITYNNYSSTKMRSDLVFKTRGDAQTAASDAATEKLRIASDGRVFVNSTAVVNTDDFLTIKRPAGNTSVTSMTLDATTTTGSYANALIFTKAKDYYYNGIVFTSSSGHQGGICGKMSVAGGTAPQIDFRIGGTSFNQSDKLAMTIYNNADIQMHGSSSKDLKWDESEASLYLTDAGSGASAKLKIGTGGDLQLYHDVGGANHISAANNQEIKISANKHTFYDYTGVTKRLEIDASAKLRTRGASDTGHGGMVYIQGYSDPVADETHSNLTVRGEGGNGFACGTYEVTGNYASWIQAGYVPNFTGGSPAAIYPLVLQPNGAPVCIGNKSDASTNDAALLRIQTVSGSSYAYQKWGLSLEHFNSSNVREQKFVFINENSQGTQAEANSIFRQHATPYMASTTYQVWTDRIVYQHRPLFNRYSWYKFNVHVTSSSRGGSARIGITWSSRHAGPGGYGEYSFAWTDEHHTSQAQVFCRKQHFLSIGSASHGPYNWTSNPAVTVYSSTGGGSQGGFYLRVEGHLDANNTTYDGGVMHHFDIVHNDNNTGGNNTYFEFVQYGSSGPSQAGNALSFN